MLKGRRKLKNLIILPESQVRYGTLFLALATFTHVVLTIAVVKLYSGMITGDEEFSSVPGWILIVCMVLVYFILQAFAFILGLLMSHKVFGPLSVIRNFVGEMNKGNFGHRIKLRKNDDPQLVGLAEDLNLLATKLAK